MSKPATNTPPVIDFIDLKAQRKRIGPRMEQAIMAAIEGGQYILGPQVAEFERRMAALSGAKHVIGVGNGTDAIGIALLSRGIRPGDAVICPAFTFAATAEAVAWLGATPVFVDIDPDTYNINWKLLDEARSTAERANLKPRAVIAVDLFGQMADYDKLEPYCKAHDMFLVADSAQSFGATYKGRRSGKTGDFTTASFFPAKPLGCYGDGGAILTDDDKAADVIRSLRFHGKGDEKYDNIRIGMNSRLDTVQAAVLIEKINVFEDEIAARQVVANRYTSALKDLATTPYVMDGCISVWAQYTIRVPGAERARIMADLKAKGVPTNVYYPKPLNEQTAYKKFPVAGNGLPVSQRASEEVLSLPMHPYLDEATQTYIIDAVRGVLKSAGAAR